MFICIYIDFLLPYVVSHPFLSASKNMWCHKEVSSTLFWESTLWIVSKPDLILIWLVSISFLLLCKIIFVPNSTQFFLIVCLETQQFFKIVVHHMKHFCSMFFFKHLILQCHWLHTNDILVETYFFMYYMVGSNIVKIVFFFLW
jgi:hypothetical protein